MNEYTDPPRFPKGTPEYDAYARELREALDEWIGQGQPGRDVCGPHAEDTLVCGKCGWLNL